MGQDDPRETEQFAKNVFSGLGQSLALLHINLAAELIMVVEGGLWIKAKEY